MKRAGLPLFSVALTLGCNAIFDIEAGKPLVEEAAGKGGASTSGGNGGTGGNGGKGGGTGGKAGSSGGNGGGDAGTEAAGGTGGSDGGTAGAGGSKGGSGGKGGASGGSSGNGGSSGGTGGSAGTGGSGGVAAGAGGQSAGPGILPSDCGCETTPPSNPYFLQDFEEGGSGVLPYQDRSGGFYPYPAEFESGAELECTGLSGNCVALCLSGQLNGTSYPFAGLGAVPLSDGMNALPYDATDFSGIRFKIRGHLPPDTMLRLDVPISATSNFGGTCVEADGLLCNDHYKAEISGPLSEDTYETREVRFVNLGQGPGGGPWTLPWPTSIPANWDPTTLLNFNWQVSSKVEQLTGADFKFCIDDVELLPPDSRVPIASWDFESGAADVAHIAGSGTTTVAHDCTPSVGYPEGSCGISAHVQGAGAGDTGCTGVPNVTCPAATDDATCRLTPGCALNTQNTCEANCGALDDSLCVTVPGCFGFKTGLFGLSDTVTQLPMQTGDTLGLWFQIPSGTVHWMSLYVQSGATWEGWMSFPINMPARQGEWLYGEFTVPEGLLDPIRNWGVELSVDPSFDGYVYVDNMRILR